MTPAELKLIDKIAELETLLVDAKSAMEDCICAVKMMDSSNEFIRLDTTMRRIDKALET